MSSIEELEFKIAELERYNEQQDREILRQAQEIDKLEQALKQLKERLDDTGGDPKAVDERPPHY